MNLELYKGRRAPSWVAAHHSETQARMAASAHKLAEHAGATLAHRHGATAERYNDNAPPTVRVEQHKLDYYVVLDAGNDLERAIGIEYGHRFQTRAKNASGPWGQSGGIGALRRAADSAAAFGVFER